MSTGQNSDRTSKGVNDNPHERPAHRNATATAGTSEGVVDRSAFLMVGACVHIVRAVRGRETKHPVSLRGLKLMGAGLLFLK